MPHGYGYRSDVRQRKENQDTFGVFEFELFKVLIVCDGMGGHVGGRQASAIAVRTVHDQLARYTSGDVRESLRNAIEAANTAIHDAAHNNYKLMGMGTTIVAAVIHRQTCHVAWVGDSRVFHLRNGALKQVTRDHTMVNLFVDAELLSPEDAATHPEAHVLSRSLGVERTVKVDLAPPITLEDGDRVLLCSDGIHGVVGNSFLEQVDWSNVVQGVESTLEAVARADGDDNATLVAYGPKVVGGSQDPTAPPDLAKLEEEARQPAPAAAVSSRPPSAAPDPNKTDPADRPSPSAQPGAQAAPSAAAAVPRAPAASGLPLRPVMMLAGVGGLLLVLAAVVLVVAGSSDPGDAPAPPSRPAVASIETPSAPARREGEGLGLADAGLSPDIAASPTPGQEPVVFHPAADRAAVAFCHDCSASYAPPDAAAYLDPSGDPSFTPAFFEADFPAAPRRPPITGSEYDRPPPNGPAQIAAIQANRSRKCREALDTVATAIERSVDFAALYRNAWFCFNDAHQAQFMRARAETFEDLKALLPLLEGRRSVALRAMTTEEIMQADGLDAPPSDTDVVEPRWVWTWRSPATGGLEYRLGRYLEDVARPEDPPTLRMVIEDLEGVERVTDDLGLDLLLELTIAAAIARQPEHTPAMIDTWARRVYVATVLIHGDLGKQIRAFRGKDIVPLVESLYAEATAGDVPEPVAEAMAVGRARATERPAIAVDRIATIASIDLASQVDLELGGTPVSGGAPVGANTSASASSAAVGSSTAPRRRTRPRSSEDGATPERKDGVLKVWYPHQPEPRILSTRRDGPQGDE